MSSSWKRAGRRVEGSKMVSTKEEDRLIIFTLIVFSGFFVNSASGFDYNCFPGIKESPGVTVPRGDIFAEVNDPSFPIYCHLNPDHKYYRNGSRSDSLVLLTVDDDGHNQRMESRMVNETTIVAMYDPSRRGTDQVSCKINLTATGEVRGICYQNVFVGEIPIKPENFQCISENWSNLNCTWIEPENPIKTIYELSYMSPGRHGSEVECPEFLPDGSRMPRGSCYYDLKTTPSFRQTIELFMFVMHVRNAVSPNETGYPFPINSFAVVRPGAAQNVSLTAVSPHSLSLHFKIPHELDHFPVGLKFRIRYRSEFDEPEDFWREIDTDDFDKHDKEFTVKVENNNNDNDIIPYAAYTVQVRMLSATANESEDRLWSPPIERTSRSLPKIPDHPPRTAMGSFEVVGGLQDRTVFVYWQQVERSSRNGPNFRYSVEEVFAEGKISSIKPVNVTNAYAVFPHLSLHDYSFYVTSENDMGSATKTSNVFVPSHDQIRHLQPRSFTKIAYTKRLFEVSWIAPVEEREITNYTIFWCKAEDHRDRPYQCEGYLNWTEVSVKTRTANITLPTDDVYQFAVAANTPNVSSGMVWATCTILHDKVVGKLKTVSVDIVQKTSLKVRWRLDCSDRVGIVTGYRIRYCPIVSDTDTADCIDGKEYSVTTRPDEDFKNITGLTPWTFYKVGVAVVTRAGESEVSDYLVNRTAPARPGSAPTHLEAALLERQPKKDGDTVELFWGVPTVPNGPIDYYEVRHNTPENVVVPGSPFVTIDVLDTSVKISGLAPYANYTFSVRACAKTSEDSADKMCGREWADTVITTGIGKSGRMPVPKVTFTNSSVVKVEWGHLFHKGGPIQQFDLNVTHQRLLASKVLHVTDLDKYELVIDLDEIGSDWSPDCANQSVISDLYNFTIRAVTKNVTTEEMFRGEWSPEAAVPAYCKGSPAWWIIGIVVPLGIAAALATCYCFRCFSCYNQQKKIWDKVEDNYVVASPHQIGGEGGGGDRDHQMPETPTSWPKDHVIGNGNGVNAKRSGIPDYQRATSKESSEALLSPKRNASGGSGGSSSSSSSSGCVSARSSEIDDGDETKEGNTAENQEEVERQQQPYVTAFSPCAIDPSPYSQVGLTGGWQPVALGATTTTTATADLLPTGYSKLGRAAEEGGMNNGPKNATTAAASGYVAFGQISQVGKNLTTSPFSQVQPHLQQQQQQASKGYITIAQANKMDQRTNSAIFPDDEMQQQQQQQQQQTQQQNRLSTAAESGAYSKVGINPEDSRGYVHPSFLQQQRQPPSRPHSLWFEPTSSAASPALSLQHTKLEPSSQVEVASVSDSYSRFRAVTPATTTDNKVKTMSPLYVDDHDDHGGGYVRAAQSPDNGGRRRRRRSSAEGKEGEDCQRQQQLLLLSPKSVQVEVRPPYSRAVTSLQNGKSSMV